MRDLSSCTSPRSPLSLFSNLSHHFRQSAHKSIDRNMVKKTIWSFLQDQRTAVPPLTVCDLTGKTVIITGANTGLGLEAAKHIARMNPGRLIMACRSVEKGEQALEEVKKDTLSENLELWMLDMGKFESVVAFAKRFEEEGIRLDILIANAGVSKPEYGVTEDGWEETLQVNNLSTSLLCLLLAPRMLDTASKHPGTKPRIVIVSSEMHFWTQLPEEAFKAPNAFEYMNHEGIFLKTGGMNRYSDSKLLNVFFTRSLASLLRPTPVVVTTLNPGLCNSSLRRNQSGIFMKAADIVLSHLERTQEEGGRALVDAAVGHQWDPDELRGQYVNLGKVQEASDFVLGPEGKQREKKLWTDLIEVLGKIDKRVPEFVEKYSESN